MPHESHTSAGSHEAFVHGHNGRHEDDVGIRTLLSRLSNDLTQLAHDELDLAKLELRDVKNELRDDVKEAARTVVRDTMKISVALTLALLGGLALTAGAVLGIGRLLDGAFWAGGLIVGLVLVIVAAIMVRRAMSDIQDSDALRLRDTKRALREDASMMRNEALETRNMVKHGASEFKRHATTGDGASRGH